MNKLLILAAAMAIIVTGTAHADFEDGDALYEHCFSKKSSFNDGVCAGYISGVVDGIEQIDRCVPKGVELGQVRDVVKQYLEEHPEKRQLRASELVATALQEAFCKA